MLELMTVARSSGIPFRFIKVRITKHLMERTERGKSWFEILSKQRLNSVAPIAKSGVWR
jgi:hypothetical protein